jgi:hypothetical protein
VYLCEIDNGAVVLDVNRGKYFAIESKFVPELLLRLGSDFSPTDTHPTADMMPGEISAFIKELICHGVLTQSAESGHSHSSPTVSVENSLYWADRQPGLSLKPGLISSCVVSIGLTRLALTYSRLKWMIRKLRARKNALVQTAGAPNDARVRELVSAFIRIRPWLYTARNNCLLDSLAMVHFLLKCGVPATLAFGVNTNPFRAHAWVQIGNSVLNDTAETVLLYTPIFLL